MASAILIKNGVIAWTKGNKAFFISIAAAFKDLSIASACFAVSACSAWVACCCCNCLGLILDIISCCSAILATSSTDIPIDLANASWAKTLPLRFLKFFLTNDSCSFNKVAVSPVKAADLILSRLRSLPINNSASSSLDIESSKFNNDLAESATSFIDLPYLAAIEAAWAKPFSPPLILKRVAAEASAMVSITFLKLTPVLFCLLKLFTVEVTFLSTVLKFFPKPNEILMRFPATSSE